MLSTLIPKAARFQVGYIFIILQSFPTTRFSSPRFRTLEHRHKVRLFVALLASESPPASPLAIFHQHRWIYAFKKNTKNYETQKKWLESWLIRVGLWSFLHLQGYETHFWNTSYLEGSRFSIIQSHLLLDPDRQRKIDNCHICRHPFLAAHPQPSPNSFLQDMNHSRACSRILLSFVSFSSIDDSRCALALWIEASRPWCPLHAVGWGSSQSSQTMCCLCPSMDKASLPLRCVENRCPVKSTESIPSVPSMQKIARNYLEKFPKLLCYSLLPIPDLN